MPRTNMANVIINDRDSNTVMASPPSVGEWDEPTTLEEPIYCTCHDCSIIFHVYKIDSSIQGEKMEAWQV